MTDIMVMPGSLKLKIVCLFLVALLPVITAGGCKKKKTTEPPAVLPGETWSSRSTGGLYDLRDVATDGAIFVAVGDSGKIITSADSGKSWTLRSVPTGASLSGIAYTSALGFVVVSNSGGGDTVLLSSTGTNWTSPPTTGIAINLNGVTGYVSNLIAVGCNGSIFTSSNGVSWTQRTSGGVCVQAVERVGISNVEYVAVGESGAINTSPEGLSWSPRSSGVTNRLRGIAGGCSKIVVVSDGGIIKSSTNGTSWVTADSVGGDLNAITCNGDTFVAVGKNGVVYTSHDAGANWIQRTSPTTKELFGIARIGNTYLAVGLDGTVITSP
jgi:photosystem II stability/assembly factor-like uncharacterized protein